MLSGERNSWELRSNGLSSDGSHRHLDSVVVSHWLLWCLCGEGALTGEAVQVKPLEGPLEQLLFVWKLPQMFLAQLHP